MATLMQKCDVLVVLTGDNFFTFSGSKRQEIKLPEPKKEAKNEEDKPEKKEKCVNAGNEGTKNSILASAFSPSGKYFAIGDDRKQLFIYRVPSADDWELHSSRVLPRRCTAIAFPHSETEVVVADRTGDVYRFPLTADETSEGEPILGHLSMVLDLRFTPDDKYIITSDRDEKVRISQYPNAYNIHAFCLLHTEYVSQVLCVEKFSCLVSGSGDGRICTWDLEGHNHQCVQAVEVKGSIEVNQAEVKGEPEGHTELTGVKRLVYNSKLNILAVLFSSMKKISIFSIYQDGSKVKLKQEKEMTLTEVPWDVCFHGDRLVLLQPLEERPLLVFKCTKQENEDLQVTETSEDDELSTVSEHLKEKWNLIQESQSRGPHQFGVPLQKTVKTEYVDKYLEQKRDRLRGQGVNEEDTGDPPEKKIKAV